MKPEIRPFVPEADYPIVKNWWEAHGFPPVPSQILPSLGVVAHNERGDQAAAWLYMDNSVGVCMMEWMVTNPENPPRESYRAITAITEFLHMEAKALGYGVMLTTCKQTSLASILSRSGFTKTDEGMTHLVRTLTE